MIATVESIVYQASSSGGGGTGENGETGETGETGENGETGETGETSENGETGENGGDTEEVLAPPATVELPEGSVTVEDNTAAVAVPEKAFSDKIKIAIDKADSAGGNARPLIELDLTKYVKDEALPGVEVEAVKVDIFVSDLEAVAESGAYVNIITEVGEVMLDADAIGALVEKSAGAETVKLAVEHKGQGDSSLSTAQKAALNNEEKVNVCAVYDISLYAGDAVLDFSTDGKLTIGLPYMLQTGENASGISVYHIRDSGKPELMNAKYDGTKGLAVFTTSHLSVYAVTYERSEGDDTPKSGGGCDAGFGALTALLATGVFGSLRKSGKSGRKPD